jgi:hypothetical protein
MVTDATRGTTRLSGGRTLVWLVEQNRVVGWWSLAAGATTGLVLGLWSFGGPVPIPGWVGDYGDLSRRFLRLGHIAFFGLGLLNVMMARSLPTLALGPVWRRVASICMNAGNVLLPPALFAAGGLPALKYLAAPPATAVTVALVVTAYGVLLTEWERRE